MSTSFELSRDELFYLHSLKDSELEMYLKKFPPQTRRAFLEQMTATAAMFVFPKQESEAASTTETVATEPGNPTATLRKYCPHAPWPKQQAFLDLTCEEAFYGGAAAGGKSDTLLMAALQYVHVPGYHALILRRDMARLKLPGSIMDRAKEWLNYRTDAQWSGSDNCFRFPTAGEDAVLQFGYIDSPDDRWRYNSAEFQLIAFDELTEFRLPDDESNPYEFMFSRLRRTVSIDVPLRVRSASTPGNIGHAWVKRRFLTAAAQKALALGANGIFDAPLGKEGTGIRKFVPARIKDNPAVIEEEYRATLKHLPPITQDRMMNGDWSVAEGLVIPETWLRYYQMRGEHLVPMDRETKVVGRETFDCRGCRRFATIDTAGTGKDKAAEARGKSASYSVIAVWDHWRQKDMLFLRHVWRAHADWPELRSMAIQTLKKWNVKESFVEDKHIAGPLCDELKKAGVQCQQISAVIPGMSDGWEGAKKDRAIASGLLMRLAEGNLLLPAHEMGCDWIFDYEHELTSWSGHPDEVCDQIDVSSYASYKCKQSASSWGGTIKTTGMARS